MPGIVVQPVVSRRERQRFFDYPWSLYRGDPNWIPPLRGNQKALLGFARHPFYENAESQTFLALRDGQVCGRIAAIVNREHNRVHQEQRGFFGFFECADDQDAADALFGAARAWLAERRMTAIRGPANPSMNYECGLLIEGFDSPPTFMMTYNPPYYARLVEGAGFRKAHDLLAYIGYREWLPEIIERLGSLAAQALERSGATIRPMNPKRFLQDVELFLDLYNRSLGAMWGFVPLPAAEMKLLAHSLRRLVIPELAVVAEVDGRGVGAIIGLPDFNPAIKAIDGRLFPLGFRKLLAARKHVRRMRVLAINVVPEYQRWGLGLSLMASLVPKGLELGVQESEFSWVSEANDLARLGLEKGGARVYKTYRMYDGEIG